MKQEIRFPGDFLWGTATSSYQIEGGWDADGKGESIWDRFCHTPGKIENGDTGDIACDHYHRWREDVDLMQQLGIRAYRFSISWPRVLPTGRGQVNQAGLDFYSRLVDALLEAGITPFVTLYHWDLPQALQDEGGWAARSTAEAFVAYAGLLGHHLGDRVKHWITHNELSVAAFVGHLWGEHAPGIRDAYTAWRVSHHLLLSHGWAVPAIRQACPGARVGAAINLNWQEPASNNRSDLESFRRADGMWGRWFLDPLYGRHYPADMVADAITAGELPAGLDFVQGGDLDAIAAPTDFLGLNYYTRFSTRDHDPAAEKEDVPTSTELAKDDKPRTEMGWEIYPEGLFKVLSRLYLEYQVPKIYITENGASFSDGPDLEGRIRDERRLRYLRDHFAAARRAMDTGVPLAGYFVWSFMDNFEWAQGYNQRFGLLWVDFDTLQRLPKDSALWYKQVIANNGFTLEEESNR